ncbi:MAG: BMP family protein [Clostridia bacterium]|nr:BMP family protein [Clostridia bacterium]
MKKLITLALALVMALNVLAFGSMAEEKQMRVACILSGPISDMSWNYTAHQGMLKIEAMGAEIAYQENVENSALPDCINTYASDGFDMIILSTNSYEEASLPIVQDYPETQFIIINGQTTAGNVTSYAVADEDQGFMQGFIAATLSKTGKVGFLGSMEITPILNGSIGFEQGAKFANENVEVNSVMLGTFTDVAAAKETTTAMIANGVDAVAPMCDAAALGVVEAAEAGNIVAVASGEGQETIAPHAVPVAVIKDTSILYAKVYEDFLAGKLTGDTGVLKLGAADGIVFLSDWYEAGNALSDEVKAQIVAAYEKLVSGEVAVKLG